MIVFDLKCARAHVFEAWFGSSADYEEQKARGLLACPICDDAAIEKAVMAPAVATKSNQRPSGDMTSMATSDTEAAKALLRKLAELQKAMTDNSEYVGQRFADEARAMHYGESGVRGIYGETSPAEAAELRDEGISAMPLLFPVRPRGGDA